MKKSLAKFKGLAQQRAFISLVAIIVTGISIFGYAALYLPDSYKSFDQASKVCGSAPVIGSIEQDRKIYYQPNKRNNQVLSQYDPALFSSNDYTEARYYCSLSDAERAGYENYQSVDFKMPTSSSSENQ